MIMRDFRNDEQGKYELLDAVAFGMTLETEGSRESPFFYADHYGAFEDNGETLMSQLAVYHFESRFAGQWVPSNGVGDVATFPQYRGRGYSRELFHHALRRMKEQGEVFSYLYPFHNGFYRRFGYELVHEPLELETNFLALREIPAWPRFRLLLEEEGDLPLREIYDAFAKGCFGALNRNRAACPSGAVPMPEGTLWKRRLSFCPKREKQYVYLIEGERGPEAYLACRLEEDALVVFELCFCSPEALLHALGAVRLLENPAHRLRFTGLPQDTPLTWILNEYTLVNKTIRRGAMARVVDVPRALSLARYAGSGEFVLAVEDFLPWNEGTYHVVYENGRGQVHKLPSASRPDIRLPVSLLARFLFGTAEASAEALRCCPGVSFGRQPERFFAAFGRQSVWINDAF